MTQADQRELARAGTPRPVRALEPATGARRPVAPVRVWRSVRDWLTERHGIGAELAVIAALYGVYELTRGFTAAGERVAIAHAHDVVVMEQTLHIFFESEVQRYAQQVPGLLGAFGVLYLICHLGITGVVLFWLHRNRPGAYPAFRTTLLVATAVAVIGYIAYPTAPPRLSGLGIVDTVTGHAHVDLNHGLIHSIYNPFAAIPSMHAGYALVVGVTLVKQARNLFTRVVGYVYPVLVLVVIVATGNHFFLDAVAGILVVGLAALFTAWIMHGRDQRLALSAAAEEPNPGVADLRGPRRLEVVGDRTEPGRRAAERR